MSPRARSTQHHRLRRLTWNRQHARAIRRAERIEQEVGPLLVCLRTALHAWAVAQDGQVDALPPAQQAIYHRHQEPGEQHAQDTV